MSTTSDPEPVVRPSRPFSSEPPGPAGRGSAALAMEVAGFKEALAEAQRGEHIRALWVVTIIVPLVFTVLLNLVVLRVTTVVVAVFLFLLEALLFRLWRRADGEIARVLGLLERAEQELADVLDAPRSP